MIYNEITLKRPSLEFALNKLRQLESDSSYRGKDPDDLLMQTSISETSDAVVEMYRTLQHTEDAFRKLLHNTILAIENAGISFDAADHNAAMTFNDLPYTPQFGPKR